MEVTNIISTEGKIDGIPYWIIPGDKDIEGNITSFQFVYRDKLYEVQLDDDEIVTRPFTSKKMAEIRARVLSKMRAYLRNHPV